MFGKKKTTGTATPVPQVSNKKKIEDCLTSMSFLSHFVIDKKESLVEEEIKTVRFCRFRITVSNRLRTDSR